MQVVSQSSLAQPAPFPVIPAVLKTARRDVKLVVLQTQLCSWLRKWFLLPIWHCRH